LTSYEWTWNSGSGKFSRRVTVRFKKDGTAAYSDTDKNIPWVITGPRSILVGANCPLEFDEAFRNYRGNNEKEHWPITGRRLELPAQSQTPRQP
jgi:hypothetical protein